MSTKIFLEGFGKGLRDYGENFAVIVNSVLLFAVYALGVGLTAIAAKLLGKRFLETGTAAKNGSYWKDLDLKKKSIEDYYRQF